MGEGDARLLTAEQEEHIPKTIGDKRPGPRQGCPQEDISDSGQAASAPQQVPFEANASQLSRSW